MTDSSARARQRTQVADLHLAGVPPKKIAEVVGVTLPVVKRLIKEALTERVGEEPLSETVQTEIARIDAMISGLWAAARRGDVNAVDRVSRLNERRSKLVTPRVNRHEMRSAFDLTVTLSKDIRDVDAGAIQLGREYADRIDEAISTAEGTERTKALYLGPHILGVCRELLATPASRAAADRGDDDAVGGKLALLRKAARTERSA